MQTMPTQSSQNHAPRYSANRTRRVKTPIMESAYFDRWILDSDFDSESVVIRADFSRDDA